MTPPECRKCRRAIGDPGKFDGFGPKCWRAHLAALGRPAKTLGRGRRDWAADMPGQELLDIEVTP